MAASGVYVGDMIVPVTADIWVAIVVVLVVFAENTDDVGPGGVAELASTSSGASGIAESMFPSNAPRTQMI